MADDKPIIESQLPLINMIQTFRSTSTKLPEISFLQKFLLTTDGTITPILEEYAQEELIVVKLSENIGSNLKESEILNVEGTDSLLNRKILLQGKDSKTNYLYAESSIVLKRLEPWFKEKLLGSDIPIGKLLILNRIETFREILNYRIEPIGGFANYFNSDGASYFMSRNYKIIVSGQPLLLIKEKLPYNLYTV